MATLTVSLVPGVNGIDTEASKEAFDTALASYIAEQETENANFLTALNVVFDRHPDKGINLPALQSMAAQELNAQPENWNALSERVADFVRANSQGKKLEDGSFERPESMFVMGKGRTNGGVRRRTDIVA